MICALNQTIVHHDLLVSEPVRVFPVLGRWWIINDADESKTAVIAKDGVTAWLIRQADRRLGLLEAVNARLPDPRDGRYVRHDQLPLLRQRVYALCQGYEDLNDHDQLRGDLALQTATE